MDGNRECFLNHSWKDCPSSHCFLNLVKEKLFHPCYCYPFLILWALLSATFNDILVGSLATSVIYFGPIGMKRSHDGLKGGLVWLSYKWPKMYLRSKYLFFLIKMTSTHFIRNEMSADVAHFQMIIPPALALPKLYKLTEYLVWHFLYNLC